MLTIMLALALTSGNVTGATTVGAAATETAKPSKAPKPKKICERVESTGSAVPKKVCRTVHIPKVEVNAANGGSNKPTGSASN